MACTFRTAARYHRADNLRFNSRTLWSSVECGFSLQTPFQTKNCRSVGQALTGTKVYGPPVSRKEEKNGKSRFCSTLNPGIPLLHPHWSYTNQVGDSCLAISRKKSPAVGVCFFARPWPVEGNFCLPLGRRRNGQMVFFMCAFCWVLLPSRSGNGFPFSG